jgi:ubiquinone/menaquinone biosynthesis C-methylase UbiE
MRRPKVPTILICAFTIAGASSRATAQLGPKPTEERVKELTAPDRVAGLKIFDVIPKLGLKPGNIVADIGAGTGVFSMPLGQAVKPGGTVYAVEVDEGLVNLLGENATEQGMMNVKPIYGDYPDPLLPEKIDLAFMNETLHHIEKRPEYLKTLAGYLKPGGRVAIIDFLPGKGDHADDPALQVSQEDATTWMAAAGLKPIENIKLYDDRWFVIFGQQ